MIFLTILVFILIFSVLVLVHEWGHFIMARKAGIKVEEFGIGLPPRAKALFTDKKGTIYSLNWIPFGGYVRLFGEDVTDPKVLGATDSYASKTKLQRTAVIVAGVFMNFLLAWFLITIGFTIGMKPFLVTQEDVMKAKETGLIETQDALFVSDIFENSPLSRTELKKGDLVLQINGQDIPKAEALSRTLTANEPVELIILRDKKNLTITATTDAEGKLGFGVADTFYVVSQKELRYPVHVAAWKSVQEVGRLSYLTVKMLGNVIVTIVSEFTVPDGVAGPVGIAKMTYQFTQQGVMALLQFTALLSISLGVINIMPFPALDGGRFLFILIEIIIRKKPNAKWESVIHGVGFIFLMLLILLITGNDIIDLFK